jgi:hypothetical protein
MLTEAAFGAAALVKDVVGDGLTELAHQRTAAERRLHLLVDECAAADRACAAEVAEVADRIVAAVDRTSPYAGWTGSAVPAGAAPVLRALGLLGLDGHGALVRWARALPPGDEATTRLRTALAAVAPSALAALLEAHPDLAARLLEGIPPELSTCTAAGVRAAFASLPPEQARRLALLFPAFVGALDGAPLAERVAANRVVITAALAARRHELADLEARRAALREGWFLFDDDDLDGRIADVRKRIGWYADLLEEPVRDVGHPGSLVGHQVLLFSDDGDGAFAELWGRVDADTRNIGLLVPGTGTDMGNVASFSENRVRRFAERNAAGELAMITWMGGDLPDSVARDAPYRNYAEELGPRLRDFVAGLDVPHGASVTVAGHSYGGAVVGVAERDGLVADRILHIESAGAGHGVRDVGDYPNRAADRYSMTAPGDFIDVVQGVEVGSTGHGADPDGLTGVVRLETGREDDLDVHSPLVEGFDAHSGVFDPSSTAWANMYQVFIGGQVQTYAPPAVHVYAAYPVPVVVTDYPMEDPGYRPPLVDIE